MAELRSTDRIYHLLSEQYGHQYWWPIFQDGQSLYNENNRIIPRNVADQWEIALGALLTQNTSWTNVEKVFSGLQDSGGWSAARLSSLSSTQLALNIRSAGYHNQKARKIRVFLERFPEGDISSLLGAPPETARQELLSLWGIGPETADSILLYALGVPFFVVDAYTRRIFDRIGLVEKQWDYSRVQRYFHAHLPQNVLIYQEYHALIVQQGKQVCRSRPQCEDCTLRTICQFYCSLP